MGLDCYVVDGHGGGRIGSYSGVHRLRGALIKAALSYLLAKMTENYPKIVEILLKDEDSTEKEEDSTSAEAEVPKHPLKLKELREKITQQIEPTPEEIISFMSSVLDNDELEQRFLYEEEHPDFIYPIQAYRTIKTWADQNNRRDANTQGLQAVDLLMAMLGGADGLGINYNALGEFDFYMEGRALTVMQLAGLYKFCNHSDCEGIYTPGDCADIAQTIKVLLPFAERNDGLVLATDLEGDLDDNDRDEEDLGWLAQVRSFFKAAADQNCALQYS